MADGSSDIPVGSLEGGAVGSSVSVVGIGVGGREDGVAVGSCVGRTVGAAVGSEVVGARVGNPDGSLVGSVVVGEKDVVLGEIVGLFFFTTGLE